MTDRQKKRWALVSAAVAILAWSVTFTTTKALLFDFSSQEILVIRFLFAWAVLRCMDTGRRRSGAQQPRRRDEWLFAAMGFTGLAFYQLLENCAIYYTNASNVAILTSFGPIVTAVLSRVILKDRTLSVPFLLGALISVCGVALVSLNGVVNFAVRPLGDLMAVGAMVCWGFYSVLMDRANARGFAQLTIVRKAFFWSLLMLIPCTLWGLTDSGFYALDGSFSITLDAATNAERFSRLSNWASLVFLGVFASAVCFFLWNQACKSLGVVRTTIGLYLTPIVGVFFAVLFLGERLTAMSIAGGLAILAGVAIANIRPRRQTL